MFIYIVALVVLAVAAYFLIHRKKSVNYVAPPLATEEAIILDRMQAAPEYRSITVEVGKSEPAPEPAPEPVTATVAIPTTEIAVKPKRVRKPPAAPAPVPEAAEPAPKPKRKAKPKPPTAQE